MINVLDIKEVSEPLKFLDGDLVIPEVREEADNIIKELKQVLETDPNLVAISAPQLGINKRIFCIRFNDVIKTFINPIIKIRSEAKFINIETNLFEGKSVAVARPKEVEVVYYTDELKMEDNKLLDLAAAIFVQQYNLLDAIIPGKALELDIDNITEGDLPLIVDATYSGSGYIFDPENDNYELDTVAGYLASYMEGCSNELNYLCESESENEDLKKAARHLRFTEQVILGRTKVIDQEGWEREKKLRRTQKQFKAKQQKEAFKQLAALASKKRGK